MTTPGNYARSGQKWSTAAAAGTRLCGARFILKRKLGGGSCSEVWLAQDVKAEREIALKILPGAVLHDDGLLQRLEQKTRRSAQLAHPAIARVYDFVTDHEVAVIATEYVDGWPLGILKADRPEKRFRIDDLTLWIYQLCAALDYAHHGFFLVHRELKPSNLLINGREQLKVTDFGIAQLIRTAAAQQGTDLPGALPYMSPQQIQGAEPSILDDIYALGATIFDLVTGTPPFTEGEIEPQILRLPAPNMSGRLSQLGIADSIPSAWEKTVAACLSKSPGSRPQSASEVLRGLEEKELPPGAVATVQPASEIRAVAEPTPLTPEAGGEAPVQIRAPLAARSLVKRWIIAARSLLSSYASKIVTMVQKRPGLLLLVVMALAAFNLMLGLWFLLRH